MHNPAPGDNPADSPPANHELTPAYWVTLYRVCLCYGGAEEGGWWYTTREALASLPIPASAEAAQAEIEAAQVAALIKYADENGETLGATYRARNPFKVVALPGCGLRHYADGETRPLRGYRSASPEITAEIQAEDIAAEDHDTSRPRYE
jgi:hypothetical protein